MLNKHLILINFFFLSMLSGQFSSEKKHVHSMQKTNALLASYHYKKIRLDDNFSSLIYHRYLSDLDFNKAYFLKADVDKFKKHEHLFDDDIRNGRLEFAYSMFKIFKEKFNSRIRKVYKLINRNYNFKKKEMFYYDRENVNWESNIADLDEYWRKRIKNEVLNLKLSGKKIKNIRELLKKRYANYERHFGQYKSEDVYQLFINSYLESIDPHTNYMSPRNSENFNIHMRLSLEGIGALLQTENEYTKVVRIIKGGPAELAGELKANDKIIAVAQGDDRFVDVIGLRIGDVVSKIRGKKGTIVRLRIIPDGRTANDPTVEITIKRDKVKLEEQAAKASIKDVEEKGKITRIGIIELPTFYYDFAAIEKGRSNFRSSSRDVHILIDSLKREKVDGIVIDLRNNGGGALQEAINLTGLFIKNGPVVQVRDKIGRVTVLQDTEDKISYDGPLAILMNQNSASASEIFAGAIQDYHRGLIIGFQSFGKGTVQRLFDLRRYLKGKKLGQVKLTTAKFYRISGESTQHKGIIPDIVFPSSRESNKYGESSLENALKWDQIPKTKYKTFPFKENILKKIVQSYHERIKKNVYFEYLKKNIDDYKKKLSEKYISLNEKERLKEREVEKEKRRLKANEIRKRKGLTEIKKGETIPTDKTDFFLNETANILVNYVQLIKVLNKNVD